MIRTIQKQWQHNETWWNKWNMMGTLQKQWRHDEKWWGKSINLRETVMTIEQPWKLMNTNETWWKCYALEVWGVQRYAVILDLKCLHIYIYINYILLFIFWFDTFYVLRNM